MIKHLLEIKINSINNVTIKMIILIIFILRKWNLLNIKGKKANHEVCVC